MSMRLRTLCACLISSLLLLASAASPQAAETSGRPQPPHHIRIQLKWTHQFQFAGYYMAMEKGYFRAAGLDVELLEGGPEVNTTQEVVNGRADFGVGTSGLLVDRANGQPVVAVASILQHSPFILAGSRSQGLEELHDLELRSAMMETHSAELIAYLKQAGVNLQRIRQLPHSGHIEDLGGKVDAMSAYSSDEPYDLLVRRIPFQVFNPRSIGIDFYGDTLFTSQKLAQESPEVVRAVRDAVIQGWYAAQEHPNQALRLIQERYKPGLDPLKLQFESDEIRRLMDADIIGIGYMNPKRWDHIRLVFANAGLVPASFQVGDFLFDGEKPVRDMTWTYAMLSASLIVLLFLALSAGLVAALRQQKRKCAALEKALLQSLDPDR